MANLEAGLRADGAPAVQAEQPEDSPQSVLPAEESRVQGHVRVNQSEDTPCGSKNQNRKATGLRVNT